MTGQLGEVGEEADRKETGVLPGSDKGCKVTI